MSTSLHKHIVRPCLFATTQVMTPASPVALIFSRQPDVAGLCSVDKQQSKKDGYGCQVRGSPILGYLEILPVVVSLLGWTAPATAETYIPAGCPRLYVQDLRVDAGGPT